MTRTQVQFPDPMYVELRRVARELDWPLAEVIRRGAEYMIRCYPPQSLSGDLPAPHDLGDIRAPVEQWRELANDPPSP